MDVQTLHGILVAVEEKAYSSFTDTQTGEIRPGGSTLIAHVVTRFDSAPVLVKFAQNDRAAWEEVRDLGQLGQVDCIVSLRAANNRLERRFVEFDTASGS